MKNDVGINNLKKRETEGEKVYIYDRNIIIWWLKFISYLIFTISSTQKIRYYVL